MIVLLLAACGPVADDCAIVCGPWIDALDACLADEGGTWESAGYAGREEALDSCELWAFAEALIARHGGVNRNDFVGACAARADHLANLAPCDAVIEADHPISTSDPRHSVR